jgi:hypothetical protein
MVLLHKLKITSEVIMLCDTEAYWEGVVVGNYAAKTEIGWIE